MQIGIGESGLRDCLTRLLNEASETRQSISESSVSSEALARHNEVTAQIEAI